MTQEEKRNQMIQTITRMLEYTPFTFEFKVVKNPKGFKIIYETTQEKMDAVISGMKIKDYDISP